MSMKKNNEEKQMLISNPKIDKLSAVIDIPELHYAKAISQNIWDELKDTKSGWVQPYSSGPYQTSAKIFCPDENGEICTKQPHMLLQVKTKGKYSPQIRVEYNPDKISPALLEHINWSFNGITGQSFWETLAHGRATRTDVCVDIQNVSPEDFMIKTKYAQYSQSVFGNDGKLQTLYFGKSKGNQYTVYNKSVEQEGDSPSMGIMRVECRLRKSVPMHQLPFIENPFERVEFYNLKPYKMPNIHPGHWEAFTDSVRFRGSAGTALKRQPIDVRSKLKYCLDKSKSSKWKPEELWGTKWLKALEGYNLLALPSPVAMDFKTVTGEDCQ